MGRRSVARRLFTTIGASQSPRSGGRRVQGADAHEGAHRDPNRGPQEGRFAVALLFLQKPPISAINHSIARLATAPSMLDRGAQSHRLRIR
jgi:hypothetical protein